MVGTGGNVGEFISQRADAPPGIAGVGIVEAAQKDVQSGLLVLRRSLFRKVDAAALQWLLPNHNAESSKLPWERLTKTVQ